MKKIILSLALLPLFVSAAPVSGSSAAFDTFMWLSTGGGAQTISYGSGGTPIITPSTPMIDLDGGMPKVTQTGNIKNPSGNLLGVSTEARVSAVGLRSAAAGVIKHSIGPLLLGMALYDFAAAVKYYLSRNPDGTIDYKKEVDQTRQGTLYAYVNTGWYPNPESACQSQMGYLASQSPSNQHRYFFSLNAGGYPNYCTVQRYTTFWVNLFQNSATTKIGEIVEQVLVQKTETDFLDDVAAKSGWPSSSASKLFADPLAYRDQKIKLDAPTVTGPATSQGTQTVTNNTTNNTTKTETVTHQHTYQGDKVTTTTTTVINVVDNSTGNTVTNETSTSSPPVPTPVETQTDCDKYPENIGCSKYGTPETTDVLVKETSPVTVTALPFAGSAACPAALNFNVSGHAYAVSYQPMCDKLAVLKYLFLAMAGFIAAWVVASTFKV